LLSQELADYQQMPDGPKIGAEGKTNDNNLRENPASLRTKSDKGTLLRIMIVSYCPSDEGHRTKSV
jgi:hypothetical protein